MIFVLVIVIFIFLGMVIQVSERSRLEIGDLLRNENDRELFIERYSNVQIDLQRIRIVGRYKGGNSTQRKVPIDGPIPVSTCWVTISETLQIVKIGKYKDKILFSTGYTEENKTTLQELIRNHEELHLDLDH
ncbi:MAG: hypothetical protein PQJ58_07765 [Spirochaetales bacterium]|nr:hypothetical protein [Spirochaetales bacterium]